MKISRRDFLKFCGISAATMGLSATDLMRLQEVLANPGAPTVVWLQGSGCTGCSVSFLNQVAAGAAVQSAPALKAGGPYKVYLPLIIKPEDVPPVAPIPNTAADILINSINLVYHPSVMGAAGELAVSQAEAAYAAGEYLLVVEGGIPTAFGGCACWAWTQGGRDFTFEEVVRKYAEKAAQILCAGTCAAWGGISATPPNPTGVVGVKALTNRTTINIAGCPPHPGWLVWAIVQLLLGQTVSLDGNGRPTAIFGQTVHSLCPRREREEAGSFGQDGRCLETLGCRGPSTRANCPNQWYNGGVNWCIGANGPCIGCTEPTFPGARAFYTPGRD